MFDKFLAWTQGDLSPAERVWTALAPAVLVCAYFLVGLVAFCIRCLVKGIPTDPETVTRGSTILVGAFWRHYFFWVIRPLWALLLKTAIPPNALTALAALLGVGSGFAVAAGRFALGGWLFLFSGIFDTMDGRVARVTNKTTPAGAALDSVLDRYVDSAILMGLAWYYRDTWVLLPLLFALLGTSLVPYVRAKGEGMGIPLRGGMMQRLERVLFLGVGTALAPVLEALMFPEVQKPMHWLAIAGILFVAVMSNLTALSRLRALINALSPPHRSPRPAWVLLALNSLAGAIATAVDFVCVMMMVRGMAFSPPVATALGALVGGVVNYFINRVVTFRSGGNVAPQMARYALVSGTSALLNAGGVALVTMHPQFSLTVAWWLVRGAVYAAWNFPLQRDYVFATSETESPDSTTPAAV